MPAALRALLRPLLTLVAVLLAGTFGAMLLIRAAPGFGVDERELDGRFSAQTIRSIRAGAAAHDGLLRSYGAYLRNLAQGDAGYAASLDRPVRDLMAERIPITLRSAGMGLAAGWLAALALAALVTLWRNPAADAATRSAGALLLCLPSSAIALALLFRYGGEASVPAGLGVAVAVFARCLRYARGILGRTAASPHVLMARARGLGGSGLMLRHILLPAAPALLALGGVSLSTALGAAIPIEVICDSPGLGQLAWHAAMKRDLPLLVNITLLVTLATAAVNTLAEAAGAALSPPGSRP